MAVLMATLCVLTMGVAAIDGTSAQFTDDNTDVLYEVTEGYTWNIHAAIDFGRDAGIDGNGENAHLSRPDNSVAVTKNIIADGKKLQITINASSYKDREKTTLKEANVFKIANGESQLAYTVTGATKGLLAINGVVLEVAAGTNTGSEALTFALDTSKLAGAQSNLAAEVAGQYTGVVTYTANIVAA